MSSSSSSSGKGQVAVIGAGFGRTGTMSFKAALEILYGEPCYHMKEVIYNGSKHVAFWGAMADREGNEASQPDFSLVELGTRYRCTADFPSSPYWKEQLKAFPNAKVVLTLHPKGAEGWYKSCMNTIFTFQPDGPIYKWGVRVSLFCGLPAYGWSQMLKKCISRNAFNYDYSKENVIRAYNEHRDRVIRECPEDKLLVFKATDGWEPLCKFLGKPVPDVPYPNVNDTKEFQGAIRLMNRLGWIITALPGVLLVSTYYTYVHYIMETDSILKRLACVFAYC